MKKNLIIHKATFTCDQCGTEEIITAEHSPSHRDDMFPHLPRIEYPYKKGWTYIHDMSFKLQSDNRVERKELKDKHFCQAVCMQDYLKKALQ